MFVQRTRFADNIAVRECSGYYSCLINYTKLGGLKKAISYVHTLCRSGIQTGHSRNGFSLLHSVMGCSRETKGGKGNHLKAYLLMHPLAHVGKSRPFWEVWYD